MHKDIMPKRIEIKNELPEGMVIQYVIGPLNVRSHGNSAHVIVPHSLLDVQNAFFIVCKNIDFKH